MPPAMLSIIRPFHEGMHAEVRVGRTTTDTIEGHNDLREGCVLPSVLFNIYFSAMVAHWRGHCPQAGVNVKYKHGRKLVGDGTTKS